MTVADPEAETATETAPKRRRKVATYQPFLVPPQPPVYRTTTVSLAALPPDSLLRGEPPDNDIIESIAMIGFVDPITIRPVPDHLTVGYGYLVDDGGRRVKAARRLVERYRDAGQPVPEYLTEVPARIVLDVGDVGAAAIALQKHATRRRNKVAEYERVKQLVASGADESTISTETRLTKGQIRELMTLDGLRPDLLAAAGESRISWGQAHDIAKLPAAAQERLAVLLDENGRIKATDVAAERSVRTTAAAERMPWDSVLERPATTGGPAAPQQPPPPLAFDEEVLTQALDDARRALAGKDEIIETWKGRAADALSIANPVIAAIEGVWVSGAPSWTRVEYQGQSYVVTVRPAGVALGRPTTLDVARTAPESANGSDTLETALQERYGPAERTRPARVKPCPHGADAETCEEQSCRRRRANRERMRGSRATGRYVRRVDA